MKKISAILLLILTTINLAMASGANAAISVIPRAEWGANEEITFDKNAQIEEFVEDESSDPSEKNETTKDDPEIKKIIEKNTDGKTYLWPLEYAKRIKFLVIHHTATTGNLDNPKTAIQNIEYYHAVRRGWGDIGYNYILDTAGKIYEGRKGGEKVIAGHARPLNKVSIGIAVLGNYEKNEVPLSVINGLVSLIAEKARLYHIDIEGKTKYNDKIYNNVQGHNENSATLCPGTNLKAILSGIKTLAAYQITKKIKIAPEENDFSDFKSRKIIALEPGEKKKITIQLRNTGKNAWRKDTFLESKDGSEIFPKILAKLTSIKVMPGEIGTFEGNSGSSTAAGLFISQTNLVINGTIRPKKTFPMAIFVENLRATYQIIARNDPPAVMRAGQRAKAWITLKNTGNITWTRSGKNQTYIAAARPNDRESRFFNNKNEIGRLSEARVKPGETGTFIFNLKAPQIGGTFTEYFAPVIENIVRMEDSGMHFTIKVSAKEKPVRVALSFEKQKPEFRSANGMNLYENGKLVHEFTVNEKVTVARLTNGGYRVRTATEKFTLLSPPRLKAKSDGILEIVNYENRPAWNRNLNDNLFRGTLEVRAIDGKLRIINEILLEDYLKGIAEVSNGDPVEKIKTIIILARSYAKYYRDIARKFPNKPYDLDDDPDSTQKYIGYGLELRSPNIVSAVESTAGKIVTYEGQPVITPYFSQSDGHTRSAEEVWGWKNTPYLQSVDDLFCGTTSRKGHGVGLSGCGATELARMGQTAEEIIKYYYKGVEITD